MYFELKVFDLPEKGKTKIQLTAGTPFGPDTQPEIGKADFNPKRIRELLHFVADDLIIRVVIKENPKEFDDLFKDQDYIRHGRGWEDPYTPEEKSKLTVIETKMLERARKLVAEKGDLIVPELTQFNFDELSPGKLAKSIQVIVNNNVPPPKRP